MNRYIVFVKMLGRVLYHTATGWSENKFRAVVFDDITDAKDVALPVHGSVQPC